MIVSVSVSLAGLRLLAQMMRNNRVKTRDEERSRNIPPNTFVEEIVSPEGNKRVRIFQRPGGTFGISIDSAAKDGFGWLGSASPGTGAVYASIEIAKREISLTLPWCKSKEDAE
jgi:hypothetical protein